MSPQMLARGIGGTPARAAFVIMIALLAGCSSPGPASPKATPTQTPPAAASTSPATRDGSLLGTARLASGMRMGLTG